MVNSGPLIGFHLVTALSGTMSRRCFRTWNWPTFSAFVPVIAFGLDEHLPLAAKAVEVVHEVAAHEGLERLVDRAEIQTPCFSTLSRSTSTKTCGTAGEKSGMTPAISGRLRAASMKVSRSRARNATSLPARSWSMNVTPPEVPMPGMAGGGKAKAAPPAMLASSRVDVRR